MDIRKIIREELQKIFFENNSLNEIGPEVAARALHGNIGKMHDVRAEQILRDAITSMFSKYIGRDKPFFFQSRSNVPPVKFELVEVALGRHAEYVDFYFYNKDGVDDDSPYAHNKREIVIRYDIENDKFNDAKSGGRFRPHYFMNAFTANFFVKAANLLRQMYYKAYVWKTQIDVPNKEKPWEEPKRELDPNFDINSRLKKGDFRMFSYDSDNMMNLDENYPMGAEYHPDAPWNQKDPSPGQRAKDIVYKLLWTDEREFALFKCPEGVCVMYLDSIDRDELAPYADREETFLGYDEDGMPDVEYGDWEMTGDVIENYVNDNLDSMRKGKGLDAYESGDYDLVLLDDELRADLMGTAKYIKDDKERDRFISIVSGQVNEAGVTDLVNKETMDTPTGNLFFMTVNENSKKKDKTVISESMNVTIKDFPYQRELNGILDMCHYISNKVSYDLLKKELSPEQWDNRRDFNYSFDPDGMDAFEPTGTINFYLGDYPEQLIDKTVSYIKYILAENDIKVGSTSREGDRVVRINVVSNDYKVQNPPDINLSNGNAKEIFEEIIGYNSVDEEMNAVDLLMKIQSARKSILTKPEKSSFTKSGGDGKAHMYGPSHGQDYHNRTLDRIEELAQWAVDNGYQTIYVA
jgi:hypothetical protein